MNKSKTKVMMENDTPINNTQIENVKNYVYLGQRYRSSEYEITDGNCVSPAGNPTRGKHLEEDRRDVGEKN